MKFIGLVFILEGNAFMKVVVPEAEARQIVDAFMMGTLKDVIGNDDCKTPIGYGAWAVHTKSIRGIHTVPLEEQKPIPQYLRGGSGLS